MVTMDCSEPEEGQGLGPEKEALHLIRSQIKLSNVIYGTNLWPLRRQVPVPRQEPKGEGGGREVIANKTVDGWMIMQRQIH